MDDINPYGSAGMTELLGETLRPGGFSLTDIGVEFSGLIPEVAVLDLGCGCGATVNYLRTKFRMTAVGIDRSEAMLRTATDKYGAAGFLQGDAEALPYASESFEGVFAECTLSLMSHPDMVLQQVHRVLKQNGWFIISDIYAKNSDAVVELNRYPVGGCMRGLHNLEQLKEQLGQAGFDVEFTHDYSQYLTELLVKIIFTYGSLCEFWQTVAGACTEGDDYYHTIKHCKPGYFLLIAKKRTNTSG